MSLDERIDTYLRGAEELRRAVAGMTPEQARARPVPGKWSTLEVVSHLADFEALDALRVKHTLALDRPTLFDGDETKFASTLNYLGRDLENEVGLIVNTRRQLARILRGQPEEILNRVSDYRLPGGAEERTLDRHLTKAINHLNHHLRFILEKRRALGLG
jgi:hypothetical protein